MSSHNRRSLLKIIILGDSGVGKTSLMHQYVDHKFDGRYKATIGADFLTKEIEIDGQVVTFQIWDTAGQERFQSLGSAFYRGADACMLVFDVTDQESFAHISSWLEEFHIQAGTRDCVLLGNKTDLAERRQVSNKTVQAWCSRQSTEEDHGSADVHAGAGGVGSSDSEGGMKYFETSAKDNTGIEEAFLSVAKIALSRKASTEQQSTLLPQTISLDRAPQTQSNRTQSCAC